ncbi:hypothetical protein F442_19992 [Phytophthora nicotianae P10297]|uniref:Uncharacterized protein n=1 Tax=Phytophthora nicotianae P10297 TaxID=1317064 RepID=W2Y904_PHYNI|nr:hypothetical protein F442_19992 [Phytophthora nicotianae P10297]
MRDKRAQPNTNNDAMSTLSGPNTYIYSASVQDTPLAMTALQRTPGLLPCSAPPQLLPSASDSQSPNSSLTSASKGIHQCSELLTSATEQNCQLSQPPPNYQTPQSRDCNQRDLVYITQEHIDELRKLEQALPNRHGKWTHIYHEYSKLYPNPDSQISVNALRCRLKPQRVPRLKTQHSSVTSLPSAEPTSRKRKATTCASCRQRKQRCGDKSGNPHCEIANQTPVRQKELAQFFSLH